MSIVRTGLVVILSAACLSGPVYAQKLYKWVDSQGNVTYQDQPPPSGAKIVDEYAAPAPPTTEGAANTPPVTFYSVPKCDACDLVRLLLQKNAVPFTEKNPSTDTDAAEDLKRIAGQLAVPSLTIGPKLFTGYNALAIENELKDAGYKLVAEQAAPETAAAPETTAEQGDNQGAAQPTPVPLNSKPY